MKYCFTLFFMFLITASTFAQVGIGTTTPSGALDISNSANGGLLIPNYALTANNLQTPVTNPNGGNLVVGTLIFNTATVAGTNPINPGFVYWNGTIWIQVTPASGGGSATGWSLTGNTGTDGGISNFLGTLDNKNLVFKTNNIARTRITTKGQIEILNTGNSIFLGLENGINDDLNNRSNIFFGFQAGRFNNGSKNIVLGEAALSSNQRANSNIVIGINAAQSNSGSNNIVLGESALSANQSASSNIVIGKNAAQSNSGSNNIILGESALSANQGASSNIVIGKNAAQSNSGSNNIILGELALSANRGASSNIVIGKNAGLENSGSKNIIIGESTLTANQAGSNNVLMGFEAGKVLSGNNNTFLGYQAGLNAQFNITNSTALGSEAVVSLSNQIVLGNISVSEVRTSGSIITSGNISGVNLIASNNITASTGTVTGNNLISNQNITATSGTGTITGNNLIATSKVTTLNLDATGVVRIGAAAGLPATSYTLPSVRGTLNQTLRMDANGLVTWQSIPVVAYAEIYRNSAATPGIESSTAISFNANGPQKNVGNIGANNIQTGLTTGVYRITYTMAVERTSNNNTFIEFFLTQGSGASNKIIGSSAYLDFNNNVTYATVTKSMLVNVINPSQQFYVYPAANNTSAKILPGSSLSIELVD